MALKSTPIARAAMLSAPFGSRLGIAVALKNQTLPSAPTRKSKAATSRSDSAVTARSAKSCKRDSTWVEIGRRLANQSMRIDARQAIIDDIDAPRIVGVHTRPDGRQSWQSVYAHDPDIDSGNIFLHECAVRIVCEDFLEHTLEQIRRLDDAVLIDAFARTFEVRLDDQRVAEFVEVSRPRVEGTTNRPGGVGTPKFARCLFDRALSNVTQRA